MKPCSSLSIKPSCTGADANCGSLTVSKTDGLDGGFDAMWKSFNELEIRMKRRK